jgi:hypothetical protein
MTRGPFAGSAPQSVELRAKFLNAVRAESADANERLEVSARGGRILRRVTGPVSDEAEAEFTRVIASSLHDPAPLPVDAARTVGMRGALQMVAWKAILGPAAADARFRRISRFSE